LLLMTEVVGSHSDAVLTAVFQAPFSTGAYMCVSVCMCFKHHRNVVVTVFIYELLLEFFTIRSGCVDFSHFP